MKSVILLPHVVSRHARSEGVCGGQDEREVNVLSLCSAEVIAYAENLATTNHLINSSETKLGHDGSQLVGHVVKEVDRHAQECQ
jgi:hypothetical protein